MVRVPPYKYSERIDLTNGTVLDDIIQEYRDELNPGDEFPDDDTLRWLWEFIPIFCEIIVLGKTSGRKFRSDVTPTQLFKVSVVDRDERTVIHMGGIAQHPSNSGIRYAMRAVRVTVGNAARSVVQKIVSKARGY